MHVVEPCVGVLTNLEVLALLRQQQRRLPSLQSLLLSHSSSSEARQNAADEPEKGGASSAVSDPAGGPADGASRVFRPETVKAYLYQHMLNHTLQHYIESTCPYLSLLDTSPQERQSAETSGRERTRPVAQHGRGTARQDDKCSRAALGPSTHEGNESRRSGSALGGGPSAMVARGLQKLLCRRFFSCVGPCLEILSLRYGLYQGELLQMLNLGASKPVEIYAMVEECAVRLSENEVNEVLEAIQHFLVDHKTTPPPYSIGGTGTLAPWPTPSSPQFVHATGLLGSTVSSALSASAAVFPGGASCEMAAATGSSLRAPQDGRLTKEGQDSFLDLAQSADASPKPSMFPPAPSVSSALIAPLAAGSSGSGANSLAPDETRTFLEALEICQAGAENIFGEATIPERGQGEEGEDPQDDSRGARRGRRGKRASSAARKPRTRSRQGSRKRHSSAGEAVGGA
ncbi:conserved hypothetical protein [Neospora caninum Liverpool]|uniref:DNA-directed RNA polymerase III subunit RPC9 n=1 Tax=Neospora caninum (strain Liverpool) TaxID=572307 RepID=F0V9G1_NEOCL|nr:conserved hypothetical protein [Neospora caninum Liverpool]CBZ50386.1 conserved hypothetical protein [Neospora caninum Liverpool]CEL64994.1 TPA: DNA-directed RNA polymerase III RPC9 [Neospora caninum Liverpool]|eukprot:XP_003880420.1 conserved hypothetical protein [Neospora caninum Liverpool]